MNKSRAKNYGIDNGLAAGNECHVDQSDRQRAECGCDAANFCEKCLTVSAVLLASHTEAWMGVEDKGVRIAYWEGVAIGIGRAVKKRLQRDVEAAQRLQASINKACPECGIVGVGHKIGCKTGNERARRYQENL